jgi:hypothetical protein
VEAYPDRFLGEKEIFFREPLSKSEGDTKAALIGECAEPWNKKCWCGAHQEYFEGVLD